ncbi:deformed epidermal autoregulatory factor 1 homolog isoform X2 [Folsomia candida]|uniref:Deformed epidermal autoregulatory factor 1 n=1 Tax=Folsomia candida TaxID=158441 RepID=A0A226CZV0_FOLCA|nr:deformed epidermal autoregulatory factor 1 homolog isoform X2 [Folsomia candida]OXA38154.1 Deformed epidermal autoregulatory factor 1 [Folsomia candida]
MERSEVNKDHSQQQQQLVQELKQEEDHDHDHNSANTTTTIICECDGSGNLQQVDNSCQPVSVSLQDQNLDNQQTEIRIKVDVDDTTSVEDHLAQLGHTNVTTASIITIPVVPYTVIGDADGNGQSISVSLANPEALTHHQLQTHQIQQAHLQQHHHHHTSQSQQLHQVTVKTEPGLPQPPLQNSKHQNPITHLTWEEAVNAAVLPIRCKDTNAELYKAKFGSGNKGKCIKSGDQWFTPTEFEALCGRGNSKDWKRSIRFGGRTLQTLIDKGYLVPHASSCICSNCVDDSSATGPIRPFTPYQRKRKNQQGDSSKSKLERLQSKDSNTDESSDVGTPITPCGITPSMNPLTQALMKMNQASPPTTEEAWRNLEDMVEKIAQAALLMKQMVKDMKERTHQETESLRSQLQEQQEMQNLQNLANSQQAQQQQQTQITVDGITRNLIESPQILRIFDSNRIQTYSIEVLDPETFKTLSASKNLQEIH